MYGFKAVIMAGGRGSRLYPLTESTPKPLLPIANIPTLSRVLKSAEDAGMDEAVITTGYRGEMIQRRYGGIFRSLTLTYSNEETPLGTAGGVKRALSGYHGSAVVLSGDAIYEGELSEAVRFHAVSGADVTIVGKEFSDVGRFGVMERDGYRITRFIEKPKPGDTASHLVNTGIYILSPAVISIIPDTVYDFGKELFPLLLALGMKVFCFTADSYWCDIGTHREYLSCNLRYSGGTPVVGAGCIVGNNADITGSVLLDGVTVGEGASVLSCIIGKNTYIADGVTVGTGSVIADNCRILSDVFAGSVITPETHFETTAV